MIPYFEWAMSGSLFSRFMLIACIFGIARIPVFGQPTVVKDINTTPGSISPYRFCKCGSYFYFSAEREDTGSELWRSDGAPAGTIMVKDVHRGRMSGLSDQEFACLNGSLIFAAYSPATGSELWKTDGNSNTAILKEIIPGTVGGVLGNFIEYSGKVYFLGMDPSTGAPRSRAF